MSADILLAVELEIVRSDTVVLSYQVSEDGTPKDITGLVFKFAAHVEHDASPRIGPITGTIDNAANGKFSIELTATDTDVAPFSGIYEVAMFDGTDKTTLTRPGGAPFRLYEDIIT